MGRPTRALTLLALVCGAGSASAQASRKPRFGLGVGFATPLGTFEADSSGEGFDVGWQATALIEFRIPGMPLGLRFDALYGENPANAQLASDVKSAFGPDVNAKMRTLATNVGLTYSIRPSPQGGRGYLFGGVGVSIPSLVLTSGDAYAGAGETRFAWNVGGGATLPVDRVTMFFELRYCHIATSFEWAKLPFVAVTTGIGWGRK